jgi:hypothetical protein
LICRRPSAGATAAARALGHGHRRELLEGEDRPAVEPLEERESREQALVRGL